MGKVVQKLGNKNLQWQTVRREFYEILDVVVQDLFDSIPKRIKADGTVTESPAVFDILRIQLRNGNGLCIIQCLQKISKIFF